MPKFESIFGKPWQKSWTAWGIVVWTAVLSAQAKGLIPQGTVESLANVFHSGTDALAAGSTAAEYIGTALIVLGIRRAQN